MANRILFIDACPRKESRTRRLADLFLKTLDGAVTTLRLSEEKLPVIDDKAILARNDAAFRGDFSAPLFRYARAFAEADTLVIAAPYWDLSFPAILKQYLEAVSVCGLTFRYTEDGRPEGLCQARKLVYITTAGGPIQNPDFGYGYVKALANTLFGIPDTRFISAENLDIWGNDPEDILQQVIRTF